MYTATMRSIIVAVGCVLTVGLAHAETRKPFGWTSDGDAVLEVVEKQEYQRCEPKDVETSKKGATTCTRCAGRGDDVTRACGVATKAIVPSLASPDRKLTLVKTSRCDTQQGGNCYVEITFAKGISLRATVASGTTNPPPQAEVTFRPDGKAVVINFMILDNRVRNDVSHVVDVRTFHELKDAPAAVRELVTWQFASLTRPDWAMTDALFATDIGTLGTLDALALAKALKASAAVKPERIDVMLSGDGGSAWIAVTATINNVFWRATELATRDAAGKWKIAGGMWSRGMAESEANTKAAANQLPKAISLTGSTTDILPGKLSDWANTLRRPTQGQVLGSTRPDTLTFGLAPKSRTVGGTSIDDIWRAWTMKPLAVGPIRAESKPGASWLLTNFEISKTSSGKSYTLPVRVWLAIDSTGDPEVQGVVLAHFAVPQP